MDLLLLMDSGIQRSRSTEAPLSIDLPSRAMSLDQILLGPSPRPFPALRRGGAGPGRGFDMARELLPRGAASPPDLEKYSPRTSPRAACARAAKSDPTTSLLTTPLNQTTKCPPADLHQKIKAHMLSQPLSGDLLKREQDSRNARLMPIMNRKTAKANRFLT